MTRRWADTAKSIYAIKRIQDGLFICFGAKAAWNGCGPARSAFRLHMGTDIMESEEYALVDLTEAYYRLEGLDK